MFLIPFESIASCSILRDDISSSKVTAVLRAAELRFAHLSFPVDLSRMSLGDWMNSWLRYQAGKDLPARLAKWALKYDFKYHRLSIRNQRTRWGSCSSQKNISLNWRLIQLPDRHADYVMLHELNHLRHMNHSKRFWDSLRRICPWMDSSERRITQHGHFLTDGCGPV